jgi:hypothetical protein
MKLIYVFVLASVLLSDAYEQVEMNCPEGWVIVGQVVYSDAKNSSNNVAMCLICELKTKNSPFGSIELCVLEQALFQIGNIYRRKQQICGTYSTSSLKAELNIYEICRKRHISPMCRASVPESTGIDGLPENFQFFPCVSANVKLAPIKNTTVDIKCPKNWKVSEIKRQERAYFLKNDATEHLQQSEICIICNSMELKINKSIYTCTTPGLGVLKNILDVVTKSEKVPKIDHTEQPNNFCGYQLIHKKGYDYNKDQLIKCDDSDTEKNIDLNVTAKNSSLVSKSVFKTN